MILKLWISELGKVVEVEVEKSELPEAFSSAAINAFKQLQFTAGERHGLPVGSVMRIEVSYIDGRLPPR
jgi:TonB family protein